MLPLLETIMGFSVIMLLLSLLIKSLTSVVKNHVDYYSSNLEKETKRLICGTLDWSGQKLETKAAWLRDFQWKRLGEDFLKKENITWLLKKLGASDNSLKHLEERIAVHKANVQFAFERRTKNISLAIGLVLCFVLNINAFSIWTTLYNDQQIRTKFANPDYIDKALAKFEAQNEKNVSGNTAPAPGSGSTPAKKNASGDTATAPDLESISDERKQFMERLFHFRGEVNFGMGRIWTKKLTLWGFLYECIGTLLTGILVSIGAPYWHDLLRALSVIRKPKASK